MLLFLLAISLSAAEPLVPSNSTIDRGEVRIGPPLVETFVLTNRGKSSLTITDVSATCGCLAPVLDRKELKPGESTNLKVEVNTLSQPAGPIGWPIRLTYESAGTNGTLELALRARLVSEIQVEPAAVGFRIRESRSVTVKITDSRVKPFRVTSVGTSSPHLRAEIVPSEGAVTQIRLTASPDAPAGTRSEILWIATDDPDYPQIKVPVTLTVLPKQRVTASPHVVPMTPGGTVTVRLRDRDGESVVVDRVECEGPVKIQTSTTAGPMCVLQVSVDPKWSGTSWTGSIKVHLRGPVSEVITIPADIR